MSSVAIQGNASGAGVFTIASPNSASSYTATLPTATTTLVGTDATQTLTNKTLTSPTITGASMSSMASSVITSGTAVASTSGTSIDFTSIPSWVKRITVMYNGVSTSGTSYRLVQLGSGSVTTTGYLASSQQTGGTSDFQSSTAGLIMCGTNASCLFNEVVTLSLFGSNIWKATHNGVMTVGAVYYEIHGGGTITLAGALDRVRITTVNGTDTFDAGSINILYE